MNMRIGRLLSLTTALGGLSLAFAHVARAEDAPAPPPGVKFYGHIEAGFVGNASDPSNGINFGQPFSDKSNDVMLNQIMAAVEKPLDPKATDFDFGFKAQVMYGSDARLTHFIGEFDTSIKTDRNQFDVVELYASAHTPWLGANGMDIKAGEFATPLGVEVIDPNGNTFYSHSYLFSFGLPLKHTGILTTTHANDTFDIYAGIDSGVNTTLGKGDTNGAPAFIAGIGVNNVGGNTTLLLLGHFGPENPRGTPQANSAMREYIDGLATIKVSDALTLTSEVNYIHDDFYKATGYGFVQYGIYSLTDTLSVAARAEVWRDQNGFFVAAFPGPLDFVNLEKGLPNGSFGGGNTTYGEVTLGLTYKPAIGIGPIDAVLIRPEIRYDGSLNSTKPYNGGKDGSQFTAAIDLIVHF